MEKLSYVSSYFEPSETVTHQGTRSSIQKFLNRIYTVLGSWFEIKTTTLNLVPFLKRMFEICSSLQKSCEYRTRTFPSPFESNWFSDALPSQSTHWKNLYWFSTAIQPINPIQISSMISIKSLSWQKIQFRIKYCI